MENSEIQRLTDEIIESIALIQPVFEDNPNGGHIYKCPFCSTYKEVKATDSVSMSELKHTEDCAYIKATLVFKHS